MYSIRLLTGAPTKDTVQTTRSKFCDKFLPAFCRYLEEPSPNEQVQEQEIEDDLSEVSRPSTEYASFRLSKWRLVPLKHLHQPTYKTTTGLNVPPLITSHVTRMADRDLETSQTLEFLRHSYHAYSQSQIKQTDGIDKSCSSETISFSTQDLSEISINTSTIGFGMPNEFEIPMWLSSLGSLSNSQKMLTTAPQQIKVNFIAGVISVLPTRTVTVRRNNREMNIVEIVVGDDTCVGFRVNFWISPAGDSQEFTKVLPTVRPKDILLLQNIVLSTYKGKVYGQSLNPNSSLEKTILEVIGRDGIVPGEAVGTDESKKKLEKVTDWVSRYLWRENRSDKGYNRRKGDGDEDSLPPDSGQL